MFQGYVPNKFSPNKKIIHIGIVSFQVLSPINGLWVQAHNSILGEDIKAAIIFFRFGSCGFEVPGGGISIEFSTQGVYEQ